MAERAPLLTPSDLERWVGAEPGDLAADRLMAVILWGVSVIVREAGDTEWERDTLPEGARLIAILVAKHYYEHPTGAISEAVAGGPSERYVEAVLQGMSLDVEQRRRLADLAEKDVDVTLGGGGFWTQATTNRPPDKTTLGTIYVLDTYGAWPIPYFDPREPLLQERSR